MQHAAAQVFQIVVEMPVPFHVVRAFQPNLPVM
jgi:hypothetical protein